MLRQTAVLVASAAVLSACSAADNLPPEAGVGPQPKLPAPIRSWLPTVKIAKATGWPAGGKPVAADGFAVAAFASGLDHPRWLYALPNGDILVAESNAPAKKPDGVRDWVMGKVMGAAGAGVPSPDRIVLLRDADGDGAAEQRSVFIDKLTSPFGMALVGDQLYVAAADALLRYPYAAGQASITAPAVKVTDLPGGPINHHWTKNVIAGPGGAKLYVTVGSNSNVGENGMAAEAGRAAIWEVDRVSGAKRIFASGIRNPNGLDFQPQTGALWTVANERDELGDDLVPDYLTSVADGGFYGWPYSYYGGHLDPRVKPQRPDLVAKARAPDYALGSHVAPLGMTFYRRGQFAARYVGGAFIGEHGSWNRSPVSGYKVVFVPFAAGRPAGPPEDVLTGFLDAKGRAQGRPVGVITDASGALLVADDVGNAVWRVTSTSPRPATSAAAGLPSSTAR